MSPSTSRGGYVSEVDKFSLYGTDRSMPNVEILTDQGLPARLGLAREGFAATILVRLADEPSDEPGTEPTEEITIESDSRISDLSHAIDILIAARDALEAWRKVS